MQRLRFEAPVLLEVERSRASLRPPVIEGTQAALDGAPHQVPVLEVVGCERARLRVVAGVVRQDFVAVIKRQHRGHRRPRIGPATVSTSQSSPNASRKASK